MRRTGLLAILLALAVAPYAAAQFSVPVAKPTPEALFRNQCATCHALDASETGRMGPELGDVIGRQAGTVPGFKYSAGFADADFKWDSAHLDAYLENPQAVVPGAVMPYRQANADTRKSIVSYLEAQR
jgi:cytochrome c